MTGERKRLWLGLAVLLAACALGGWIVGPWHPTISIGAFQRDLSIKLGLDLQGGSQLIYRADVTGVSSDSAADALAGVRDVIERRVNAFGVSEPVVQTSRVGDEHRVIVELAGVHDPHEAIRLIGETPQLDFRREVGIEEATAQFNIDDPEGISGPIFERTELTGKNLRRASVSFDPVIGQPQVNLEFDGAGTELFADLTRQNLGQRIAIYLDGVPISAPVVQAEITNGQAVISGGFSLDEAKQLAQRLNAGALPIPIELIGQQTIGPSLGQQSVQESVRAGIAGLAAVALWLILFYRLPGIIGTLALLAYAIFFLAIIKLLPVTLTLAGVAGSILSIGMAVDANVLINERFKENLRAGKSVGYALRVGFREAWGSINAANVSSLLTAVVLYAFGTSIIRGFALTLGFGIALSMLVTVTVTKLLMLLLLSAPWAQRPFLLMGKYKQSV